MLRFSDTVGQRVVGLAPGQGEIHVLVVDDQDINRNLLRAMLEPLGFIVDEASGGCEALEMARFRMPRIILMDLVMPEMDGAETTRRLRAIPSGDSVTIIGISASTFLSEKQDFLEAGIDAFIAKPFRKQDLYDELARHAGVAFVTEEAASAMTGGANVPSLERMSPAWLKRFSQALSRGNITRIRNLGDEARESDPLLSAYLLDRADLYDLDGLKKLVPARNAG
jgi:CheY-like chemotaxis protein